MGETRLLYSWDPCIIPIPRARNRRIDREAIRAKLATDSSSEDDGSFSDTSNPNRIQASYGFNGWQQHSPTNTAHTLTGSNQHSVSQGRQNSGPSPNDCGCPIWATKMRHHRSKHERRARLFRTSTAQTDLELLRNAPKSEAAIGSSFNLQICFMNDPVNSTQQSDLNNPDPAPAPSHEMGRRLERTTDEDPRIVDQDGGLEDSNSGGAQSHGKRRTTRSTGESSIKTTRKNVRATLSPIANGSTGLSSRRRKYKKIRARREQIKHLRCLLYPLVVAASNTKTPHLDHDQDPLLLRREGGVKDHEATTCCPDFVYAPRLDNLQIRRSEGSGTSGSDEYEEFYDGILVENAASEGHSLQLEQSSINNDPSETCDLEDARFRLQEQAKIALSQAPLMARMQVEVERELKKLAILQGPQPTPPVPNGGTQQCRNKHGIAERAKSIIAQKLFGTCKTEDKVCGPVQSATSISSPHSSHANTSNKSSPAFQPCQTDYSNHRDEVESIRILPTTSPELMEERACKPSLKNLCNMPIAQLQILANRYLSNIEALNEELVQLLMERDDLHMEQDSILVDIEDITGRVQENTRKNQKSPNQQVDRQASMCGTEKES